MNRSDAIPPPPGAAQLPDPPPFGWVSNIKKLTGAEVSIIQRMIGAGLQDQPLTWTIYCAVAFARRVDPQKYPWSIAEILTVGDVMDSDDQAPGAADPT